MFMFSLPGDACEWCHSLPHASISSLGEFRAAFNRHCQKFYSYELIYHNCCEEYRDGVQDIVRSCESYEDEGYTSKELINLVKSLSIGMEKLEADHACCSYEGDAEDISVLETNVFGSCAYDEEVISNTNQEQPTFDEYPNEEDEESKGQFISCPEPISEKPSPKTSQPASIVHSPVITRDIQPCVRSYRADRKSVV